jgi:hypothetical protein
MQKAIECPAGKEAEGSEWVRKLSEKG